MNSFTDIVLALVDGKACCEKQGCYWQHFELEIHSEEADILICSLVEVQLGVRFQNGMTD